MNVLIISCVVLYFLFICFSVGYCIGYWAFGYALDNLKDYLGD